MFVDYSIQTACFVEVAINCVVLWRGSVRVTKKMEDLALHRSYAGVLKE